jgi:hypothetical protein
VILPPYEPFLPAWQSCDFSRSSGTMAHAKGHITPVSHLRSGQRPSNFEFRRHATRTLRVRNDGYRTLASQSFEPPLIVKFSRFIVGS